MATNTNNSNSNNIDIEISVDSVDIPNDSITDLILRKFASYPKGRAISFRKVCDKAKTIHGELAFGLFGSERRAACQRRYTKYLKQVERGVTPLEFPDDFCEWDYLTKTVDLVVLLNTTKVSLSPVRNRRLNSRSPIPKKKTVEFLPPSSTAVQSPPPHVTMEEKTGKQGVDKATAAANAYNYLLQNSTNHAISFNNGMENVGFFAFEQHNVKTKDPNVYTTKVGFGIPLDTLAQAKHAKPRLRVENNGLNIMLPVQHPLICGTHKGTKGLLETALDNKLKDGDKARGNAIDLSLGATKPDVDRHDLECADGTVMKDVPFVEHSYILPPGLEGENKYFNDGKPSNDDHHLDAKLIMLTNIHTKDSQQIIKELQAKAPTAEKLSAAAGNDKATDELFSEAKKYFVQAQTRVDTIVLLYVEFSLFDHDRGGRHHVAPKMDLANLFDDVLNLGD